MLSVHTNYSLSAHTNLCPYKLFVSIQTISYQIVSKPTIPEGVHTNNLSILTIPVGVHTNLCPYKLLTL